MRSAQPVNLTRTQFISLIINIWNKDYKSLPYLMLIGLRIIVIVEE